jgi:hypothetical protein
MQLLWNVNKFNQGGQREDSGNFSYPGMFAEERFKG